MLRVFVAAGIVVALGAPGAQGGVVWDDATDAVGISFHHAGEVHTDPLVGQAWVAGPEIIGSGACLADLDGDGFDDLYIVNQQFNPENPATEGWIESVDPTNQFYVNQGDGTFSDRTGAAGLEGRGFGFGCAVADYDGDRDLDIFVANFGDDRFPGNQLFRNNGDGIFTDVAPAAGVAMAGACGDHPCHPSSSAWADYDLDGDLDLYVGLYTATNLTDQVHGPGMHIAQQNWLFRNNGDGTFDEVAHDAGVAGEAKDQWGSKTLGVIWLDYDLDGDMDLYVANDQAPNDFYENLGDGSFVERSNETGLADDKASMGVTAGDYDNDGFPDLYFTHHVRQENGFYRNQGNKTYEDRSGEDDLHNGYDWRVGWGTHFVDIDRDMDLDIVAVNGHTGFKPPIVNQTAQVFRNDPEPEPAGPGDRLWVDVTNESGPGVTTERGSRGAAFGDYDLDGDTDFVRVQNNNQTAIFAQASGVANHWLYVQLRQPGMNAFGVGARVIVEAGGVSQFREVQAGSSYLSQNSLNMEFGLGAHLQADRVTVEWPGGGTTVVEDVPGDQVVRVDRDLGGFLNDTLSPATRALPVGLEGKDGWWRSPVDVTLEAEDRGVSFLSGVASTEFATAPGPMAAYAGQVLTLSTEGVHVLRARSVDAFGNVEPIRSFPFGLDFTPPTGSIELKGTPGANGWWVSPQVQIAMQGTDDRSGVDEIRFRIDDKPWTTYVAPVGVRDEGVHVVELQVRDVAGNLGPVQTFLVRLDRTSPEAVMLRPAPGAAYLGAQELEGAGLGPAVILVPQGASPLFRVEATADDALSGVARVEFALDGAVVAIDTQPPYQWIWNTAESAGTHALSARAYDEAGNAATAPVDVVVWTAPPPPGASPPGWVGVALLGLPLLSLARRRRLPGP